MIKEIREELDQLGEESYRQFNQKLIPGTDHVIGVRKIGRASCRERV